jgi:2-keto-3-deoxy-L-rhamnonate aldolase RhmA
VEREAGAGSRPTLSARLESGFLAGSWITIPDPAVIEAMAAPGLDFLVIDAEHGPIDLGAQHVLIGAARGARLDVVVRVSFNDQTRIMQALDAGASGVLIPQVANADDVRRAITAARYPPVGQRGWGPRRPTDYGRRKDEYLVEADQTSAVMVMIERREAIEDLDGILQVQGLAAVLIGPSDLSGSLGFLAQPDNPAVQAAIDRIISTCSAVSMPVGIAVGADPAAIGEWRKRGCTFVVASADYLLLARGIEAIVGAARET